MDRYKNYTVSDYIRDDNFIRWVKTPNVDHEPIWESVKKEFPDQEKNINHAAEIIRGLATYYPEVPDTEIEDARRFILHHQNSPQVSTKRSSPFFFISIAASILISLGIALWFFMPEQSNNAHTHPQLGHKTKSYKNDTDRYRAIRLPDSSTIALAPGSNVTYNMENPQLRQVYLIGTAFFKVTKNAQAPFYVYSNELVTKVIGTTFKISPTTHRVGVKVEVSSGKVKVYRQNSQKSDSPDQGIILTPNQSATYYKEDLTITRSVVEEPRVLVSTQQLKSYSYIDTPISEVFDGLEKIYGIKVIYDKDKFKNCKLNMALSDESLFQKLELIGKVVEARYNVIDGQVIIIGDGCQE